MTICIHTLSLIFSLTIGLEVFILSNQYHKDKIFKGMLWWIAGIALIGIHFFVIFLQEFINLGVFALIIENTAIVASILTLQVGIFRFFNIPPKHSLLIGFIGVYSASAIIAYTFGNFVIPSFLSAISVAAFSLSIAKTVYGEKSPAYKSFIPFTALAFLLNGVFFLINGLFWIIFPPASLAGLPTTMQYVSYFVLFVNATLWTFGFIFLLNQRLMHVTVESKEKYNLMFETIPDAVLISRLSDGLILEVNQGFTKLSGYSEEDVQNRSTLDVNIWYDAAERSRFVILVTETGSIENMEFQFRRKNGRPLLGLVSSRAINVGEEVHVLSVVRDITSRKKMEDKLRENEQKYRFLTDNSGDVIWHINRSYRVDYISAADERIRGFKPEEVIGGQIWSIFKPEGVQLVREKIEHHEQTERVGDNMRITRFEVEQKCKDDNWIWTEIVAAPHYDKDANLIGYHGISRDITERKQLVDTLYQQATIDELTQVPNRRHFMNLAEIELRRAKRYHHPLSIVVVDFDGLKNVNDTYGHSAGDRALTVFTKIVKQIIRDVDVLGRFGGDEFLLLLPETDTEHAELVVERIHNVLASSPIFYGDKSFKIAISSGIASIDDWADTIEILFDRADEALYNSKNYSGNGTTRHGKQD